ncbi:MAG TPA: twin-arginine translocase TatA/TatE family subunit [Melioribacteraceae bacterium]|nr:twin-arginine translocase TatA/TatE family subunit [Melioribacteraceae bacterium]
MFGAIGLTEILIILFIMILFFGGRKIPELAKGFADGIRSFKRGLKEE